MLYIPITEATLGKLTQSEVDVESIIANLCVAELAALWFVQRMPELLSASKSDEVFLLKAERVIANFITEYASVPLGEIQRLVASIFSSEKLANGAALLEQTPMYLMSSEQMREKKYLQWDGQWDWEFKNKTQSDFQSSPLLNKYSSNTIRTSNEEERIVNTILSERDEPLDIQGYAGSGKTWIISRLMEVLDKDKTIFLSLTWGQVSALISRIPGAKGYTFANIAEEVLSINLIGSVRHINRRYKKKYVISDNKLAEYIQCHEIGNHRREYIANRAWSAVSQFCHTRDTEITLTHIQKVFPTRIPEEQELLLSIAKNLWELICIPRDGVYLPIRDYHLVKALALTGMGIPSRYAYVVVDETHNLSPPVIQILQQSLQPILTFGDYYQALEGLRSPYSISATLRKKTLSHSVRAGANIEELYNKIIERHPIVPEVEFSGNKTKVTKLIHYDKYKTPDRYCAILARSTWSVLVIARELSQQAARYHIIESVKNDLKWLVNGAISFYKTGDKPEHYEFSHAYSWSDFVRKNNEKERVLLWVDRLIRSGFDFNDLDAILKSSISLPLGDAYPQDAYIVGRVRDCRNVEFDRVLLLDDVVGHSGSIIDDHAKVISHIYTGISRAKHEIYIPERMTEWLDDF